jgi:mevalonate kinase
MKVVASSPGKITLFGEHAVVYKKPAIVASIDKRVYATCRLRDDDKIKIRALNLEIPGIILTYDKNNEIVIETDYGKVLSAVSYIKEAISIVSEYIGEFRGVDLEIESTMPVGAGLGTSAAVSVVTIASYSRALGHDVNKDTIASLAWETEKKVQGLASPMDSVISTFGGVIYLTFDASGFKYEFLDIGRELPIVIGYVRRKFKTKDMVALVKSNLDKHPELVRPIIDLIGETVILARDALLRGDLTYTGELMNINHGLLDALGVSTKELSELVYIARLYGAYGSKLSGAGGGGAMIALVDEDKVRDISSAINIAGGQTIDTVIGGTGLRYEYIGD